MQGAPRQYMPTPGEVTRRSDEPSVSSAGLANAVGEYNCFLNVIIQCLWHCTEFRRHVKSVPPESLAGHPVVAALFRVLQVGAAGAHCDGRCGAACDWGRGVACDWGVQAGDSVC